MKITFKIVLEGHILSLELNFLLFLSILYFYHIKSQMILQKAGEKYMAQLCSALSEHECENGEDED